MQPEIILLCLYELNLIPIVIILRVFRAHRLIKPRLDAQIQHILESGNFFSELFWSELVDRRQGAAENLEYMLGWQSIVIAEASRWVLREEQTELLLRVCQKVERVDHVCEVDLHLVILPCD